jgi:hypothetical protein
VDPVNGQATDICVATFASAIPAAIKPFKLLPYGWAKTYAPGLIGHIPMIVLKNVNGPAISLGASTYWAYGIHSYGYSLPSYYTPSASAFYLATSTGDSGSPTLIYNPASNELGLAGVCYSSANASDVTDYIPQLNQYLWGDYTGGYTSTCYQIGSSTSPGSNPWSPGSSPPNLTYLPTTDLSSYPTY